jgi:hypothetical protein
MPTGEFSPPGVNGQKTKPEDFNTRSWFEPCLKDAKISGYT